ncbi:MAG: hypothetical protein ACFCU3_08295 [Verrucomicrobiales bacterium]
MIDVKASAWYRSLMKNITVSVPDEVYHRARVRAAERRTSISAIVRTVLEDLAETETEFDRLRRLETETLQKIKQRLGALEFTTEDTRNLTRDELHDR